MTFSEFAQILYKIQGGNKYEFTHELLTFGLVVSSPVLDQLKDDNSGKDRLRKYFSGKRDITEIASEILAYFDRGIFIDALNERYDEHYDGISKAFAEAGFSIDPDDAPKRLTEIFVELLENAAAGQSPRNHPTSDIETALLSLDSSVLLSAKTPRERILGLLTQIKWKYDELMEFTMGIAALPNLESKEAIVEQEVAVVSQFIALNQRLRPFFDRYPDFSSLQQLHDKSSMIDVELYRIWNCKTDIDSPVLKEYCAIWEKCLKEAQALPD